MAKYKPTAEEKKQLEFRKEVAKRKQGGNKPESGSSGGGKQSRPAVPKARDILLGRKGGKK